VGFVLRSVSALCAQRKSSTQSLEPSGALRQDLLPRARREPGAEKECQRPPEMHVSYFCTSYFCTPEPEFLASEAMGMNRSIWPRGNFFFESFQVRHNLQPSDLFFDDRMQNSPFIGRTSVIQEQAG